MIVLVLDKKLVSWTHVGLYSLDHHTLSNTWRRMKRKCRKYPLRSIQTVKLLHNIKKTHWL